MKWPLEQRFPADTAALSDVRAAARAACHQAGCGSESTEQMVLAVNEACMNIIQHGYRYAPGKSFLIRAGVDQGVMVFELLDNGYPAKDEDLRPRELDELRPGGLGVRFMRELMNEVAYVAAPEGFTNCLQMRRRIS